MFLSLLKWLNFLGQNESIFFSQCTERKKLSHFVLKSWVTGGAIIRPGKLSNWSIFKSIWLSMLSQFDSQWGVNLTLKVESIWLSMLSQFDSQCWVNLTLKFKSIWLSRLSQFDSQCEPIWFSMLSQFDCQCWVNLTLNVESIWLLMLSQFDS